MKTVTMTLTLTFTDEIDDTHFTKLEIMHNVMSGLLEQVNHMGLKPEDSPGYTESIDISMGQDGALDLNVHEDLSLRVKDLQ